MRIRLNGEPHDLDGPVSVSALLAGLSIDARRVAVEHNLVVVKRAKYDDTLVNDGDEVEIVNFVGGGSPGARGPGSGVRNQKNPRNPGTQGTPRNQVNDL